MASRFHLNFHSFEVVCVPPIELYDISSVKIMLMVMSSGPTRKCCMIITLISIASETVVYYNINYVTSICNLSSISRI